jgi:hypothetical protein
MRILLIISMLLFPFFAGAQSAPSPFAGTQDGGTRPVPDPTILTTQAQEKASVALREILDARILSLENELSRQKTTLDNADARLIIRLDGMPDVIATQVTHLQRLMEEKFKGVDQQFQGRDVALAAALLAQKTSVDEQNKANAASSASGRGHD